MLFPSALQQSCKSHWTRQLTYITFKKKGVGEGSSEHSPTDTTKEGNTVKLGTEITKATLLAKPLYHHQIMPLITYLPVYILPALGLSFSFFLKKSSVRTKSHFLLFSIYSLKIFQLKSEIRPALNPYVWRVKKIPLLPSGLFLYVIFDAFVPCQVTSLAVSAEERNYQTGFEFLHEKSITNHKVCLPNSG